MILIREFDVDFVLEGLIVVHTNYKLVHIEWFNKIHRIVPDPVIGE